MTLSNEYKRNYDRGWRYSTRPTATLDHGDSNREPEAWYDGYLDQAAGRPKWTSAKKTSRLSLDTAP